MLMASLLFCLCAPAQTAGQGIVFEPAGTQFRQAVQKALSSNKFIFVDCYTSWCGPCKMMAREVFPQPKVGSFMNPSYVSLQIDMEKGEGPELGKKWEVSAYPTFIVFNSRGQELGRFLGGSDADQFIQRVKDASVDKGVDAYTKRWEAGERSEAFLFEYLGVVSKSNKREQCNLIAEELLRDKAETFVSDEQLRRVFMSHLSNPLHPAALYVTRHPEALRQVMGDVPVDMKLRNMWSYYGRELINEHDGVVTLDEARFQQWVDAMRDCQVAHSDEYRLNVLIELAKRQKDWTAYVSRCEEFFHHPSLDVTDIELCKWMNPLMQCQDMAVRERAAALLQQRYDDLQSGRRERQTRAGNMMLSGNLTAVMPKLIRSLKGEQVDFSKP